MKLAGLNIMITGAAGFIGSHLAERLATDILFALVGLVPQVHPCFHRFVRSAHLATDKGRRARNSGVGQLRNPRPIRKMGRSNFHQSRHGRILVCPISLGG